MLLSKGLETYYTKAFFFAWRDEFIKTSSGHACHDGVNIVCVLKQTHVWDLTGTILASCIVIITFFIVGPFFIYVCSLFS